MPAKPITPIPVAPVPRLALRRQEAAESLSISDRTLSKWTKDGSIPHVIIGGVVMYPVDRLAAWLSQKAEYNDKENRS